MASILLVVGNLPVGVIWCPKTCKSCEKKAHLIGLNCMPNLMVRSNTPSPMTHHFVETVIVNNKTRRLRETFLRGFTNENTRSSPLRMARLNNVHLQHPFQLFFNCGEFRWTFTIWHTVYRWSIGCLNIMMKPLIGCTAARGK